MKQCSIRWLFLLNLAFATLALPTLAFAASDEPVSGRFAEVENGKIY
jgi:hypothetical protein